MEACSSAVLAARSYTVRSASPQIPPRFVNGEESKKGKSSICGTTIDSMICGISLVENEGEKREGDERLLGFERRSDLLSCSI
jgi:hypothetical protein